MESVITEEQLKAHLMATDVHFRHLVEQHHLLDDQLNHLDAKSHLSDDEQIEEARLKKAKLRIKDEMAAILKRH